MLVHQRVTILKNMSSSMGRMTSHIWNGKYKSHVPKHQPALVFPKSPLSVVENLEKPETVELRASHPAARVARVHVGWHGLAPGSPGALGFGVQTNAQSTLKATDPLVKLTVLAMENHQHFPGESTNYPFSNRFKSSAAGGRDGGFPPMGKAQKIRRKSWGKWWLEKIWCPISIWK